LFVADDDDVIVQRRIATVQVCLTLSDKFEPNTKTASVTKLFIKYVYYKVYNENTFRYIQIHFNLLC